MPQVERTFCRICHLNCSLFIEMIDGKPTKVYGDKLNPVYHGFTCIKGREIAVYNNLPSRLIQPQKRNRSGSYDPISYEQATSEIAEKVAQLIEDHGPRAVACYGGTPGANLVLPNIFAQAFLVAIASPMWWTALTIDQPGKFLAKGLTGEWAGGLYPFRELDTQLLVGNNPLVSMGTAIGIASAHDLKEAQERGLKLIVVDPRRCESAQKADIHLQARPGEDAAIIAGMIHVIIEENLYDSAFVADETAGFTKLKEAVAEFNPDYVARRAGIDVHQLVAAARMYASGHKGSVSCGTGPNMSGRGMLVEYLGRVLMTICGHWPRAGESTRHPGLLVSFGDPIAGSTGPFPTWGFGEKLRIRGFRDTVAGLPTAALNDEILTPGDGQIKALIVVGGNPMSALPNQLKSSEAMRKLELLVCVDPQMSSTARMAHYVIPPKLPLETAGVTVNMELLTAMQMASGFGSEIPYVQYTPALISVPPGSDLCEEWEFFFDITRKLGRQIRLKPISILDPSRGAEMATPLDMTCRPSSDTIWSHLLKASSLPFEEIKRDCRAGRVYDVPKKAVAPKPANWTGRLDVGNDVMMAELRDVASEDFSLRQKTRAFRLTVRRILQFHNSAWIDRAPVRVRRSYNPAYMNPDDMEALAIVSGSVIEITSDRASILAIAEGDPELRRGCLSLSHAWGSNPDEDQNPLVRGSPTSRLINDEENYDPYSGIPIMSAIPIDVRKVAPSLNVENETEVIAS